MKDDDLMLIGILAALVLGGGSSRAQPPGRWVWPLPRLPDGRVPVVSDGYHVRPSGPHEAIDLMYRRRVAMPGAYPLADHGSRLFELPAGTLVLAAGDARVWSAGRDAHGHYVVLDHGQAGGGWSTVYRHLDSLAIPEHAKGKPLAGGAPTVVRAGDVLGPAGYDPTDHAQIRHLHFAARAGSTPFDPSPLMPGWGIV